MRKAVKFILALIVLILGAFTIGVFLPFPLSAIVAVIYGVLMGMVMANITINYY